MLHSVVDVLTHHDDGPLLFFPFSWTIRFYSPISYWDPAHFGRPFAIFELVFDLVLVLYLFYPAVMRVYRRRIGLQHESS